MKAKVEFTHESGVYKVGDAVKVKNKALIDRWKADGFIEEDKIEVTEEVESVDNTEVSDSKPRESEV